MSRHYALMPILISASHEEHSVDALFEIHLTTFAPDRFNTVYIYIRLHLKNKRQLTRALPESAQNK